LKDIWIPRLSDVFEARKTISRFIRRTPLIYNRGLSEELEADIYIKCENQQVTGAFKVRGGLNLMAHLSEEEKKKGVVAVSTGNHGQSIAYAAMKYGVEATIVMPEDANPYKVEAIKSFGAKVVFHGKDFDEAKEWTEKELVKKGVRYIHSGDEPYLIAGVATIYLEVLEDLPDVDIIIVPVGGGSGASGACIVAKNIDKSIRVIGVQSSGAPAVYYSWKNRDVVKRDKIETFAEGLATRAPFSLPLRIMWKYLDDMILVDDADLEYAIFLLIDTIHQIAEGAGAASTAAALKMKRKIRGKKVVLALTGGNITTDQLRKILMKYP
jgi:threonine dehydratase